MRKSFLFAITLPMLISNLSIAQNYILKADILDGGGTKTTSSDYICQLSIGQSVASGIVTSGNYKGIIGFWHNPYGGGLPGIEEVSTHSLSPVVFNLAQNLPNPFANRTVIQYSLPKETEVCLKVYNSTGRVVTTLVQGKQQAGIYNVVWNVRNVPKEQLPAGTYFYRLKAGEFTAIRKMVKLE
ncbi:MAG: T9SS type A sorting domain-containing protein [candidate division WOR-3 bacterium]